MEKYSLEELCSIITDGTHQTPEYSENGYIFLSSKDVTMRKINWKNVKRIPKQLHEVLSARLKPQLNDILLAKNGTTGVAAIVDKDKIFDIYVSLALLRPKEMVYPKYLLYAINSPQVKRQFNRGLKGIGVPNLHLNVIRKTKIPLPQYEKQQEIVKQLEAVDKLIETEKEQIEQYNVLIKSRFVEMFGDVGVNSKKLPAVPLGELCGLITKGASPNWQGFSYTKDITQTLFVTSENVRNGYINLSSPKYIEDGFNDKQKRSVLQKGDFLINIVGASIGRAAQFNMECKANINQATALVRINDKRVREKYLLIYLNSEKAQQMYDAMKSDTGRANLSIQDIRNLSILLPSLKEQVEFENFVNQVDKLKFSIPIAA